VRLGGRRGRVYVFVYLRVFLLLSLYCMGMLHDVMYYDSCNQEYDCILLQNTVRVWGFPVSMTLRK
jgi:hypothetical protein